VCQCVVEVLGSMLQCVDVVWQCSVICCSVSVHGSEIKKDREKEMHASYTGAASNTHGYKHTRTLKHTNIYIYINVCTYIYPKNKDV